MNMLHAIFVGISGILAFRFAMPKVFVGSRGGLAALPKPGTLHHFCHTLLGKQFRLLFLQDSGYSLIFMIYSKYESIISIIPSYSTYIIIYNQC